MYMCFVNIFEMSINMASYWLLGLTVVSWCSLIFAIQISACIGLPFKKHDFVKQWSKRPSLISSYQWLIGRTKTTAMEDVSTGVLEKIKNIYEVKIKPKMICCIKTYIIAYVKIQKKWKYTIQYVKPTVMIDRATHAMQQVGCKCTCQ